MNTSSRPSSPAVSVLVLLHNRPTLMRQALDSIIGQTFEDFECILLDNGSNGNEVYNTAQEYADKDPRIQLSRSEENLGVHRGRNALLKKAQSEYVATLEDDDFWALDKLEKQVAFMRAHPQVALYSCSRAFINIKGNQIKEQILQTGILPPSTDTADMAYLRSYFGGSGPIFRRDELRAIGGWREYFVNADDVDLFYRLQENFSYAASDEKLLFYRLSIRGKGSSNHSNLGIRSDVSLYYWAATLSALHRRHYGKDPIDKNPNLATFVVEELPKLGAELLSERRFYKAVGSVAKALLRNGEQAALKRLTGKDLPFSSGQRRMLRVKLFFWSLRRKK